MESSTASISMGEEIKPYKMHVSSKYLELTQKKLELTRLPHELLLPKAREWENGTPKSEIEPLIDFWYVLFLLLSPFLPLLPFSPHWRKQGE